MPVSDIINSFATAKKPEYSQTDRAIINVIIPRTTMSFMYSFSYNSTGITVPEIKNKNIR